MVIKMCLHTSTQPAYSLLYGPGGQTVEATGLSSMLLTVNTKISKFDIKLGF